jgi:microcystin-dependent protein
MNCNEIIKIAAVSIIVYLLMNCINNKENFRYTTLQGANNIVLTDEQGNLSSIQFPKGMVMIWTGDLTQIPQGWALCDGKNGTPDLRGRFVLGVNSKLDPISNLTPTNIKDNGGAETHVLTIDEMPSHTHDIIGKGDDAGYCKSGQCGFWPTDRWTNDAVVKASTSGGKLVVENTGGSKPHNNMPPFLVLAYIMKL